MVQRNPVLTNESSDERRRVPGCPRAEAERALAAARATGDSRSEAAALTDLGVMSLAEGDARGALPSLQEALAIAGCLGDRTQEADVLANLGVAVLGLRQTDRAREIFARQLAYARETGDTFAEKSALERLGYVCLRAGKPARALGYFEPALELARRSGDGPHQSSLLWSLAVAHAELGQRAQAIAQAQAALALLEETAQPQAPVFREHLRRYCEQDAATPIPATSPINGAALAGPANGVPVAPEPQPAGLLRMAFSAASALVKALQSGCATVAPQVGRRRLEVCGACVHHTGLRCKVCGCFTNVKTQLPYERCPLGKWPA